MLETGPESHYLAHDKEQDDDDDGSGGDDDDRTSSKEPGMSIDPIQWGITTPLTRVRVCSIPWKQLLFNTSKATLSPFLSFLILCWFSEVDES